MYPLTPVGMGTEFNLDTALRFGTLPLVRNLPGFSRFLPVAALFHGQVLNLANVARDAGITRSTAQGFFEILEDTLMAARQPGAARSRCSRSGTSCGCWRNGKSEAWIGDRPQFIT